MEQWKSEINIAKSAGIDAFILNTAKDKATHESTIANAFDAAEQLGNGFKLAFMFDYLALGPWSADDVKDILNRYGPRSAHFKVDGKPLVSTFEGWQNDQDWPGIRAAVPGGIHFLPDWTSQGPQNLADKIAAQPDLVDGAFSWDMWPRGANDVSADPDYAWKSAIPGKAYMMGVSPWFYTRLPDFGKAWVWRGDDMWHQRWQQVLQVRPDLVQIVTWNDYGESHYVGPITGALPPGSEEYVNDMPHDKWRDLLPYYIAQYKGQQPVVDQEKITMWYRLTSSSAGDAGGVTGNNCDNGLNQFPDGSACVDAGLVSQDKVFVTVLIKEASNVAIKIGDNAATTHTFTAGGAQHTAQAFNGQVGPVVIEVLRGDATAVVATGRPILPTPTGSIVNFNAWVGGS